MFFFFLGGRDTSAKQMWWNINIPTCRVWTGWKAPDLSYLSAETKDGSGTLQHLWLWKKSKCSEKTQGTREVRHAQHMLDIQKKENQSWNDYQSVALFVKPIQGRYIKGPRRLMCCCHHLWVFGIHLSLPKSPILCIQMVVCFLMQDDCVKVMAVPAHILPTSKVP